MGRQECNNFIHFIQWALLDSSGEPYYLMYLVIDIKQMRENIIVKFGAHFEDFSALNENWHYCFIIVDVVLIVIFRSDRISSV